MCLLHVTPRHYKAEHDMQSTNGHARRHEANQVGSQTLPAAGSNTAAARCCLCHHIMSSAVCKTKTIAFSRHSSLSGPACVNPHNCSQPAGPPRTWKSSLATLTTASVTGGHAQAMCWAQHCSPLGRVSACGCPNHQAMTHSQCMQVCWRKINSNVSMLRAGTQQRCCPAPGAWIHDLIADTIAECCTRGAVQLPLQVAGCSLRTQCCSVCYCCRYTQGGRQCCPHGGGWDSVSW